MAGGQITQVTVFGGSGFIGRHLVRKLAERGWRVRIACRNPDDALPLKTAGAVGQIVPTLCNIQSRTLVDAAVAGSDIVINLVGILAEGGRQKFDALQADGARRVASAAHQAGVKQMVQVSAIGAVEGSESAYARSKAAGEAAVRTAFPEATILRPSIVFGPDDGFFNLFGELGRYSPFLPLIGGGHTKFQPVYVGDVVAAIMASLDNEEAAGKTYELGGPEVVSFKRCLEIVAEQTNRPKPLVTIPWGIAKLQGRILGMLPQPLLTVDQVTQLKVDNVVSADAPTLADLGITPTPMAVILPTYMHRFRPGGRFADKKRAVG